MNHTKVLELLIVVLEVLLIVNMLSYGGGLPRSQKLLHWAQNISYATSCAEEDNLNIPLFADYQVKKFQIVATHPQYPIDSSDYPCPPIWEGCPASNSPSNRNSCNKLWDDGTNVVEVCTIANWWRPHEMQVQVKEKSAYGNYLRMYRKIAGQSSWPQFLVIYEDGNMRLKPHLPQGMTDVCFGSSVIIGPAVPAKRPFADIQQVEIYPEEFALLVTYRGGDSARFDLTVNRLQARLEVDIDYRTDAQTPFAFFRSMWVQDGLADADHIETTEKTYPVLGAWDTLDGPWWFFHRAKRSAHNPSSPDIWIGLPETQCIQAGFTVDAIQEKQNSFLFDANSSIDTIGEIIRYEWDWNGDGTYDTAVQNPQMVHRFAAEGPYEVILTIVDDQGNRASCTKEVSL